MIGFLSVVVLGLLLIGGWLILWGLMQFVRGINQLANPSRSTLSRTSGTDMTAEEEGNAHSGPYGYSPNTAYPQTQYGSLFNPNAKWNTERHHDRDYDSDDDYAHHGGDF